MSIECEEYMNLINAINSYANIRRHYIDLQNFLKGYNEIIKDYTKKLQIFIKNKNSKIDYITSNADSLDFNLSFLTKRLGWIIKTEMLTYEKLSEGITEIISDSANFIKEQDECQSKTRKQMECAKSDLVEKYKKIEKSKNTYFDHATNIENLLIKIQKYKKQTQPDNTNTNNTNNNSEEENMNNSLRESLKKTKKYEKDYKTQIKLVRSFEDSFLSSIEESYNITELIGMEIVQNIKSTIINAMVIINNSLKMILMELDTYMPIIIESRPEEKFETFLTSIKSQNEMPFKSTTPQSYKIKILDKFKKHNQVEKNDEDDNNSIINSNKEPQASIDSLTFNDIHQIVKIIYNNMSLKDDNTYNIEKEENKILINQISNQLLIQEETKVDEASVDKIKALLKEQKFRKLFLQKLNDLRGKGVFKMEEKKFKITGELLNLILVYSEREKDFYSIKNLVILSQTFYYQNIEKKSPKIYLQVIIQRNPIMQSYEFWENFVNNSVQSEVKEIIDSQERNKMLFRMSEKEAKKKLANLVFAQLLALSDNMREFGIDKGIAQKILEPIILNYKISKEEQDTIFQMLEQKRVTLVDVDEFFSSPLDPLQDVVFEKDNVSNKNE